MPNRVIASNVRIFDFKSVAQPGKSKPGSLDIWSNPNPAIEGQIFEMPFTDFGDKQRIGKKSSITHQHHRNPELI